MKFEQADSDDAGPGVHANRYAHKFPKCEKYLKLNLSPTTFKKNAPNRYKLFVKYCGGSEEIAVEALTFGRGPLVQINSKMVKTAQGKTTNKVDGKTVICYIHAQVADTYESGTTWVVWESTVLHELIHWARWVKKVDDPEGVEIGKSFETEAYGEDIGVKSTDPQKYDTPKAP